MTKFSVIVPVYNAEKFIKRCVGSILSQSYKNIEVILINDGSTDATETVCNELARQDDRVKYHKQENQGPSIARQHGLSLSTGDYVSFIDSDDYIEDGLYEEMALLCTDQVDIVEFGYYLDYGEYKHCFNMSPIIKDGADCLSHYIHQKNVTNYLCNKIFKKTLFEKVEFPHLYMSEDQCILAQLYHAANKIQSVEKAFYNYYMNPSSLCNSSFSIKTMDVIKANDYIYQYLLSHRPKLAPVQSTMGINSAILVYNKLDMNYSGEDKKQLKKEIVQNFRKWLTISKEYHIYESISFKQRMKWFLFSVSPGATTVLRKKMKEGRK